MSASEPQARAISIRPPRIISRARPIESVPEEQAVDKVQEGPVIPKYILTFAAASLFNAKGAVNGGKRFTPAAGS